MGYATKADTGAREKSKHISQEGKGTLVPLPFAWKLSPPQTMGSKYNGAKMISTWAPSMRVPVSS